MHTDSLAQASWAAAAEATCGYLAWVADSHCAAIRHNAGVELPPPEACIRIYASLGYGEAPEARLRGAGQVTRSYQECYGRISAASIEAGLEPAVPGIAPAAMIHQMAPPGVE